MEKEKRITELERQNQHLQENNTKLKLENRELKTPASRWKALVSCERLRLLGRAGFDNNDKSGYRHFIMEFWTKWVGSIFDNSLEIETLEKYADCLTETGLECDKLIYSNGQVEAGSHPTTYIPPSAADYEATDENIS